LAGSREHSCEFPYFCSCASCQGCHKKCHKKDAGQGNDLRTDTKTKGAVEELKLLSFAARKDITELILMNGNTIHVSLRPRPFQKEEEMGIRFGKGDEIAVTGSRVKLKGTA
jgi:hypothetical protein